MTILWYALAAGMCLSSAVCHLALGLKRPRDPTYLMFAATMAVVSVFQLVVAGLHSAKSADSAIELARFAVALAIVFWIVFSVFVHRYTGVRVSRTIASAFFVLNAGWLAYDLVAPYGLLFDEAHGVFELTQGGAAGWTRVPFGPIQLGWHAFSSATALWCVTAAWRLVRRGHRARGINLAVGVVALAITVLMDALRDALGRDWPYVGGFGVMVLAMVLSARLAYDFRKKELLLARMLQDATRIRDELNTPLQTLKLGIDLSASEGAIARERVTRLQRAVDKLTELGRSLRKQHETTHYPDVRRPTSDV